jgi:hypothetical protein|nr:MAG TPA_asm: hypothetical protein [Caudoviricetes sp.]
MTASDIFKTGAALLAEKPGEDPDTAYFTPTYLSIILMECLDAENTMREAEGKPTLETAPIITSLTQEIEYSDRLTRVAIPYALAAHYYRENGDNYHEQMFRAEYVSAVAECQRARSERIIGVYD